jgi:predicted ATPase/transcriptional regulator with XRE-family HTH domain
MIILEHTGRTSVMTADGVATFGEMLRARRLAASLTQESLAERAGISARAIADLERGIIRAPRRDTLDMLAEALGLAGEEREHWYQLREELSHRGTPTSATPSLPAPPNQLIGREREVNALVSLLTQPVAPLVTITGPGGVGKTRIALAAGHALQGSFHDGVYFFELASIRDADLLLPTIAERFRIRVGDPESILQQLFRYFSRRRLLLILDNAEHIRIAVANLASVLATDSDAQVLVTSRAGLRISAEHEFPISPLRLPDWDNTQTAGGLQSYPAIQLFVQRAQQVRPDFVLTASDSLAISRICSYLDGLPLAIELAAARVKVLSPGQIAAKLVDRLGFLTGGFTDAPDRHQTMRATIAWSYELLNEQDRQWFNRLSAFVGGWTLEAAEALATAGTDVVESHFRLANDNLIYSAPQHSGGQTRFHMLETVREFGQEQLELLGERDDVLRQHARYYLDFSEQAEPELRGPDQIAWLHSVEGEMGNIRAALEWAARPDIDPESGLRIGGALAWYWECRGPVSEGREQLTRALSREGGTPATRMKALAGAGWLAHIQRDSSDARTFLNKARSIAGDLEDSWMVAWTTHLLGRVAYFDGDAEAAYRLGRESLEVAREIDDEWIIAWAYHLLALAAHINGDLGPAREYYEGSLEIRNRIGYPEGAATVTGLLGMLTLHEGDHVSAFALLRQSLEMNQQLGARWLVENMIANIVSISAGVGDFDRAARLAGFVSTMSDVVGAGPIPIAEAAFNEGASIARDKLGDDLYEQLSAAGSQMTMDEAIAESLALSDVMGV